MNVNKLHAEIMRVPGEPVNARAHAVISVMEALDEWDITADEAKAVLADALEGYRALTENEAEAAWEAMNDPERVAGQKHREATAHLDGFGRSLK